MTGIGDNRRVRISILGPLEVRTSGGASGPALVAGITGGRLRTLLILLALEAGRIVTADRLIDGIWGEHPPAGAPNALQSLVSRLRRLLPPDTIESHPTGYRLAVPPDAVDAHLFEELAADGRAALGEDDDRASRVLREALGLWRGPALADAADAEFARSRIARLEELRLAATEDRIDAELALGRHGAVIAELEELTSAHPLRERPAAQLMRALRASGQSAGALAVYERVKRALVAELGADPSPELQKAHLAVLRGEPLAADQAATPPVPELRTNLRSAITSFVGREEDLRGVGKQLAAHRLVTLTGPGGAGKTRLATECARDMLDDLADGAWLVQLAPITEPAEVPRAVLSTLGLRENAVIDPRSGLAPGAGPGDRLASALGGKEMLLVLDNCEHVIDAAADLADRLLGACPRLRVLATSRERLGITGEVLWPVPSLAMPDPGATAEDSMSCAAVRLLADRAAAVRPDFMVTAANVADVVAICRALDGMPLAIELAAARLRSLSERQVAGRLGDRFRLLTGGSRTALPRHQTLRAVVEWSWELLSEQERALARRLSVFQGGATLEAVERVCGNDELDVASVLSALVDKSLIVPAPSDADTTPRYRMLETIRAYGIERLTETGELDQARDAHSAYFLERAETGEPLLRTRHQLEWFAWYGAEHDNLNAALRWAIDSGDKAIAVRLGAALSWWWWLRGLRVEGGKWTSEICALEGPAPLARYSIVLIHQAFFKLGLTWDFETAREELWKARQLQEGIPDPHPVVVLTDAFYAFLGSDFEGAVRRLTAKRDDPDPWIRAASRLYCGAGQFNAGRIDLAVEQLDDALERFRELDEDWGAIQTLSSLAEVAGLRGDHVAALRAIEEALALAARLGAREDIGNLLMRRGWTQARLGDIGQARADMTASEELTERLGLTEWVVMVAYYRGEMARLAGDLEEAVGWYRRALDDVPATGAAPPQHIAMVNTGMALLEVAQGNLAQAADQYQRAVRAAIESFDYPIMGMVAEALASRSLAKSTPEAAAELLGAGVALRGVSDPSHPDVSRVTAETKKILGESAFTTIYDRAVSMPREDAVALLRKRTET